jgi:hypothetical protein
MNITLTLEDVQYILNVLGELPTKTGAWTLLTKIKEQAELQLPKEASAGE